MKYSRHMSIKFRSNFGQFNHPDICQLNFYKLLKPGIHIFKIYKLLNKISQTSNGLLWI